MINKVILMGRLTRDPEVRHTSTGKAVCSFSIAIDNGYGENRQTDFINCVAWQNQAEFLGRYFTKGMMVIVAGRISTRTWEGQDGKKNYVTEVIANEVNFGESKKSREENSGYSGVYNNAPQQQAYSSYGAEQQSNNYTAPAQQMPGGLEEDEFTPLSEIDDDLPF